MASLCLLCSVSKQFADIDYTQFVGGRDNSPRRDVDVKSAPKTTENRQIEATDGNTY